MLLDSLLLVFDVVEFYLPIATIITGVILVILTARGAKK